MGKRSRQKKAASAAVQPTPALEPRPRKPETSVETASNARLFAISAGLVVLVGALFGQLATHDFLTYDDPTYVTRNQHVLDGLTWSGVKWAFTSLDFNWHPLTWLTHMLDVQLFGVDAGAHLLVNAAIHAANAVILFLLVRRMTAKVWPSAIVAALFAVHPLHVESVAWIAERKDVLSTLFLLLTIWFYVDFVRSRGAAKYTLVIASFVLGFMAKGTVVTLPFALLLLDYWPLARWSFDDPKPLGRCVVEKLPLFALDVPAVFITLKAQQHVAAVASAGLVPLKARIANAFISYASYLGRTIWPSNLAIPYPYRYVISSGEALAAAALLVAISAAVLWQAKSRPYLFTGWFWFVGVFVPMIGLVQIGVQSMADRYTYVPLIGIFIAAVWLAADLVDARPDLKQPATIATVVVLVAFAGLAARQAGYWKNSLTLFTHSVEVTPGNYIAHDNLGEYWYQHGEYEKAIDEYTKASKDSRDVTAQRALAMLYRLTGNSAKAIESYETAAASQPDNADVLRALGDAQAAAGNTEAAAATYRRALAIRPDKRIEASLATLRGDVNAAVDALLQAEKASAPDADLENDLAAALAKAGREQEALGHYEKALELNPALYDAQMNIGALLSRLDRTDEALEHFRAAAGARPKLSEPHVYIALVEAQRGDRAAAIDEATAALAIDPEPANRYFSKAIHMAYRESNLRDWIAFLKAKGK